jgi:hypothetical protein
MSALPCCARALETETAQQQSQRAATICRLGVISVGIEKKIYVSRTATNKQSNFSQRPSGFANLMNGRRAENVINMSLQRRFMVACCLKVSFNHHVS